jgi:hypothetical protein
MAQYVSHYYNTPFSPWASSSLCYIVIALCMVVSCADAT